MADLVKGERLHTVEELMALGSNARIEVIEGEIVEMSPVGGLHHFVAGNIYDELRSFTRKQSLGYVFMDGLVFPREKELHQYHRLTPNSVQIYQRADTLEGGMMLPSFTLAMHDVFVVPKLA